MTNVAVAGVVVAGIVIALVVVLCVFLIPNHDVNVAATTAAGGPKQNPAGADCAKLQGFTNACAGGATAGFYSPQPPPTCYTGDPVNDPVGVAPAADPSLCNDAAALVYARSGTPGSYTYALDRGVTGADMAGWLAAGPLACDCEPTPPPATNCPAAITTQSSLVLDGAGAAAFKAMTSADAKSALDSIFIDGSIYGDGFVTQCDPRRTATDDWSKLLCGGQQVQVCPEDPTGATACEKSASCSKCSDYFAPLGAALHLTLESAQGHYTAEFKNLAPAGGPCATGRSYRGVCIPAQENGVATALDQTYTDADRPFGIALYHGGKAGLPEVDAKCFVGYALEIASFVEARNIERVFLSVDAPLPYDGGTVPQQNSYFLQPQFMAANFLARLGATTAAGRPREVGLIVYASPGDSGWNFQIADPYDKGDATTDYVKNLKATCDAQWKMSFPDPRSSSSSDSDSSTIDPFPLKDDGTQCFSNPAAGALLGGSLLGAPPAGQGCGYFDFEPLGSNTPCATTCYEQTCSEMAAQVECHGDDAVCADYAAGHCAPYATQATATCGTDNRCKLTCTAPQCDPTSFAACAQKTLCCGSTTVGTAANVGSDGASAVRAVFPKISSAPKVCGCPNIASQVVAYVTAVNSAVDALVAKGLVPSTTPKVTMIAYDGEDAHANNGPAGQCQTVQTMQAAGLQVFPTKLRSAKEGDAAAKDAAQAAAASGAAPAPGSLEGNVPQQLGHAYSMGTTPYKFVTDPSAGSSAAPTSSTLSFAMPEMYWYMGINWPCIGSANNLTNRPEVCTTQMAYRDFQSAMAASDGALTMLDFYLWILAVQPCTGDSSFTAMQKNMRDYRGQVWPMISSEYLSGSDPSTDNPVDGMCLARAANAGVSVHSICGTCDMMYTFGWTDILQFFGAVYEDCYNNKWGHYASAATPAAGALPFVALYEAQFINPKWTKAGKWTLLAQSCVAPSVSDGQTPLTDVFAPTDVRGRHAALARAAAAPTDCSARCTASDCRCKYDVGSDHCVTCSTDDDCGKGNSCVSREFSHSCSAPSSCTASDCRCKFDVGAAKCVACSTSDDCGSDPGNSCGAREFSKSCGSTARRALGF
jgi:hypothetical protein